jgi:hypothetical protein
MRKFRHFHQANKIVTYQNITKTKDGGMHMQKIVYLFTEGTAPCGSYWAAKAPTWPK